MYTWLNHLCYIYNKLQNALVCIQNNLGSRMGHFITINRLSIKTLPVSVRFKYIHSDFNKVIKVICFMNNSVLQICSLE